jgi:hypothetical protein
MRVPAPPRMPSTDPDSESLRLQFYLSVLECLRLTFFNRVRVKRGGGRRGSGLTTHNPRAHGMLAVKRNTPLSPFSACLISQVIPLLLTAHAAASCAACHVTGLCLVCWQAARCCQHPNGQRRARSEAGRAGQVALRGPRTVSIPDEGTYVNTSGGLQHAWWLDGDHGLGHHCA